MSEAVKIAELRSRLNEAMSGVETLTDSSAQSKIKEAYDTCVQYIKKALDSAETGIKNTLSRLISWIQSIIGHVNEAQINESLKAIVSKFISIAKFVGKILVFVIDTISLALIALGIVTFYTALIAQVTGIVGISLLALSAYNFVGAVFTTLTGIALNQQLGIIGVVMVWAFFSGWGQKWRKYEKPAF